MRNRTILVTQGPDGEAEHICGVVHDPDGPLSWLSPCGQWWGQNHYPTMYRLLVGLPRLGCLTCHLYQLILISDLIRRKK